MQTNYVEFELLVILILSGTSCSELSRKFSFLYALTYTFNVDDTMS